MEVTVRRKEKKRRATQTRENEIWEGAMDRSEGVERERDRVVSGCRKMIEEARMGPER